MNNFVKEKINEIKINVLEEIGTRSWYCEKSLRGGLLGGDDFVVFRPKSMGDIEF